MAQSLGTIAGQVKLDAAQALAGFAAVRASSAKTSHSFEAAGSKLSGFGKLTMGAGLAMVAGFGIAVKAAADFDSKLSYIQGVSHSTAAQMETLRAKAMQLGKDGQFSAGEIADGFLELAKAGVSVTDIVGGVGSAMENLASAGAVPLATSVEDIVAQLHTYGMATTEAGHVSDVLAGTMHASVLQLSDVASTMKYAGAVAHALGISFDSVAAATGILGKAGIKGSSAGTQLRQIMVSLTGATKPAHKELMALGIITKSGANEFFTASGKAKTLSEVFQILQDKTKGLNQEQQLMAFRTIFNNRALASAEILTKAGAKGFAEMNAQISKTTAAEVATKRLDNLNGDIQKLKGSIDTMLIGAGEPMQGFLRTVVQDITRVINAFINMPKGLQTAIIAFLGIAGAILTVIGMIVLIGGTIFKFIAIVRQTIAAFKLLAAMIRFVGFAMSESTIAFLASPITWIVIAVIALALGFYELYKHCKTFRDIIADIGHALSGAFKATINWFKGLPKFFEGVWKDISNWFEEGVGWVKKNWDLLLAIFLGPIGLIILVIHRFGGTIVNFFKAIPGEVVGFISAAWGKFVSFMSNLPYEIGFAIGFILGKLTRFAIDGAKSFGKFATEAYQAIVGFFTRLPGEIANWLTSAWHNIETWTINSTNSVNKFAVGVYHSVVTWFEKLPGRVASFFVDMYHKAVAAITRFSVETAIWTVRIYHDIIIWFEKLPGRVASFFVNLYKSAVRELIKLNSEASSWGRRIFEGVLHFITGLPGKISSILGQCISAFKGVVSQAFNAAKDFASGLWNGFKKGLGINSPSLIEKQMTQITAVTKSETTKLKAHVQILQGLSANIAKVDPSKAGSKMTTNTLQSMTAQMTKQVAMMRQAAQQSGLLGNNSAAMTAAGLMGGPSNASVMGQGMSGSQAGITFNVYNPVAEKSSDTAARKLRSLTAMGAF